jgi:hypothetical protein
MLDRKWVGRNWLKGRYRPGEYRALFLLVGRRAGRDTRSANSTCGRGEEVGETVDGKLRRAKVRGRLRLSRAFDRLFRRTRAQSFIVNSASNQRDPFTDRGECASLVRGGRRRRRRERSLDNSKR